MNDFQKQLYDELLEELAIYADLGAPPVRRLTGALASVGEAMTKLKAHVEQNPFGSMDEEIEFFKYTKPAFVAEQVYAMEMFTIESTRPQNDLASLNAFYAKELDFVHRFFVQQKFLYAYYQGGMKELDRLLFVRGAKPADIPVPDIVGLDPAFSACGDQLFARFIAFERLERYLMAQLSEDSAAPVYTECALLKWPGEKNDLIELGYALYCWLRVRKHKVKAVQLMAWFGKSFGVDLGRYSQRFAEIKMRKIASRTKFLEELRDALNSYMDEGDAWSPGDSTS